MAICTSAREPLMSSLVLSSMGCETETNVPATSLSIAFLMRSRRGRRDRARWSTPSAAAGARRCRCCRCRPDRWRPRRGRSCASVVTHLGEATAAPSRPRGRAPCASARPIDGARRMVTTMSPSSMRGTKSAPPRADERRSSATSAAAAPPRSSPLQARSPTAAPARTHARARRSSAGPWPLAGGTKATSRAGKKTTE